MDAEFARWLATLGVGGVLAGLIFMFYRKDIKQYTDLWKTTSEQLTKIVRENTASYTRLSDTLRSMEDNMITLRDLQTFCRYGKDLDTHD